MWAIPNRPTAAECRLFIIAFVTPATPTGAPAWLGSSICEIPERNAANAFAISALSKSTSSPLRSAVYSELHLSLRQLLLARRRGWVLRFAKYRKEMRLMLLQSRPCQSQPHHQSGLLSKLSTGFGKI